MNYEIDELDERILYRLVENARNTSAPTIAEEMDVAASTVRNRIEQLEAAGVIQGYHANVYYERCDGRLTGLFECSTSVANQERLAQQALRIPGVVEVLKLMSGQGNLQVKVVAPDTDGLSHIARKLTNLGLEVDHEELVQDEYHHPFHEFGPTDAHADPGTEMEVTPNDELVVVAEDAPVAGQTLQEANRTGLIHEDVLVVAIERDDRILTPRGDTILTAGDRVKMFSPHRIPAETLDAFRVPG